jgi:hypothetical protein
VRPKHYLPARAVMESSSESVFISAGIALRPGDCIGQGGCSPGLRGLSRSKRIDPRSSQAMPRYGSPTSVVESVEQVKSSNGDRIAPKQSEQVQRHSAGFVTAG